MKKVLLLGGEGFLGRNIAEALAESYEPHSVGIEKSIFFDRSDLFMEADPYSNPIKGKYDVFVHLIDHQVGVDLIESEEQRLIENTGIQRGAHLVIFSSAVLYANPESPYGRRKVFLEKFYEKWCDDRGIKLAILRLFNVYGKYQIPYRQGSLIANMLYSYLEKRPIEINDMGAKRDFMYAGDVATAVKWVIDNDFQGKTDLATGRLMSIRELLGVLQNDIFTEKVEIVDKMTKDETVCPIGGNRIFESISGTDLVDGLNESLQFYERNQALLREYLNR